MIHPDFLVVINCIHDSDRQFRQNKYAIKQAFENKIKVLIHVGQVHEFLVLSLVEHSGVNIAPSPAEAVSTA